MVKGDGKKERGGKRLREMEKDREVVKGKGRQLKGDSKREIGGKRLREIAKERWVKRLREIVKER